MIPVHLFMLIDTTYISMYNIHELSLFCVS